MASWVTYKGLEVPDSPTGDAGINLKDDLAYAVDRAPFLSSSNPSAGDDSADGFEAGSQWLNTSDNVLWSCVDATVSSAVWRTVSQRLSSALVLCPGDSSGQRGIQMDSGGNARGADALDFQSVRTAATQVASGARSFIAAGEENTASGVNSMASGVGCTASGDSSRASGSGTTASGTASHTDGASAIASGDYAHTEGSNGLASGTAAHAEGLRGVASGLAAHAAGTGCTASGDFAHASGEDSLASLYGQFAFAMPQYGRLGDSQTSLFTLRCETVNATQTEMFLDGSSARMAIATDSSWAFIIQLAARRTDANNESAAWELKGCIDNNAGTTALFGTVIKTVVGDDSGGVWAVTADADDTNDCLRIRVTGESGKTIRWFASVVTVQNIA